MRLLSITDRETASALACVDCDQVESPLAIRHVAGNDGWMRKALSNDRRHGRLEIEFRWNDVRQFWPVSPSEQALGCGMWRIVSQRHDG
jgi:hypothetical protein